MKWLPNRKDPVLHRALCGSDGNRTPENEDNDNDDQKDSMVNIHQLATKGRVRKKDKLKRNALHVACANHADLDLIRTLHELYPKSVQEPDKVGRLPLHTACSNQPTPEVVDYLLDAFPDSIYETTDRGATALFCALENKASLEVVRMLVDHDPEAVLLTQYKLGRTPVHAAVANSASLDVVNYILELRPLALAEADAWGKTPLACACMNAGSSAANHSNHDQLQIIQRLMDNTRIRKTDRAGMLPLHIACQNSAKLEVLNVLLDAYPDAIRQPDNNGRLPLHAACTNPRIEKNVLEYLIQAFPEALKTFDKMGALPLHIAIQRRLPTKMILFLMGYAKGAARTREASSKMYPLHMACRANADVKLIEILLQVYPEAMDAVDAEGNTFFHVACRNKSLDVEFVQLMLDKCSYQLLRQTNNDDALPLHIACQSRLPYDVLQCMIEYYPQALLMVDKRGNTPLHKAFQAPSTDLRTLVRLAQQDHRALNKRNKRGDRPEDCVSALIQKKFRRARIWYNTRLAYCPICIWHKM